MTMHYTHISIACPFVLISKPLTLRILYRRQWLYLFIYKAPKINRTSLTDYLVEKNILVCFLLNLFLTVTKEKQLKQAYL